MPERVVLLAAALAAVILAGCSSPPTATSPSVTFGSGGDDAGHAGYERHAVDAGRARGHRRFADRIGGSGGRHRGEHRQLRFCPCDIDRRRG